MALSLAIALDVHGPAREVLALWFFLTCPGMAIVGLLDVEDLLGEMVLAIAVSIAIGMLLALAMLVTHSWSPDAATAILLALSVLGAAAQVWIAHLGRRSRSGIESDPSAVIR